MPSLKKSTTRRRRYGGSGEGLILKNAINLLFQIKGTEYQVKHPDFIIPTADEFFGFVKLVDTDFTKHYRTTNTKRKITKFRQITPDKDIMLVSPHHGGSRLTDFLSFILKRVIGPHDTPCDRFVACITIVLYAVAVWAFLEQFMIVRTPPKTVTEILSSEAYVNSMTDLIRWFISHHSVVRPKDALVDFSIKFLKNYLFPIVPPHITVSASRNIMSAFDTILINPRIYNNSFKNPIAAYLVAEGYVSEDVSGSGFSGFSGS